MNTKILLAEVVNTKGLKGEVKLKSYTENLLSIVKYILVDDSNVSYKLLNAYLNNGFIIANIEGITNKEDADKIVGKKLYICRENLPSLEENNYYIVDLIGLSIFNVKGDILGLIKNVHNFGAGDILEIELQNLKSFMLPFNQDTVVDIDLNSKKIVIDDIYKEYM